MYKEWYDEATLSKHREFYIPNPDHPYHGVRTLQHLKVMPSTLRISADRYKQLAISGVDTVSNIRTCIHQYLDALLCEDLYTELTNR